LSQVNTLPLDWLSNCYIEPEDFHKGCAMLTIQDCIELSDLTEEEILAIAEHEHLTEMVAVELGNYLVHTSSGEKRIKRMIQDDIAHARETGNMEHAAVLKSVLKHYLETHANAA
jgi:hypothetical protein